MRELNPEGRWTSWCDDYVAARLHERTEVAGPRSGDFVEFKDGRLMRIHLYESGTIGVTRHINTEWHMCLAGVYSAPEDGMMRYVSLRLDDLKPSGTKRRATVFFFTEHGATVRTIIDFPVWECGLYAPG